MPRAPLPAKFVPALLTLGVLCTSHAARAQNADARADYSAVVNPSGAWTYGYSYSIQGLVTLFPTHNYETSGIDEWWRGQGGTANYPAIVHNPLGFAIQYGAGGNSYVSPGHLALRPGAGEMNAVLRWTAAAAGSVNVTASWLGISGDCGSNSSTADVHLIVNGQEVYSGIISGFGTTASTQGTFTVPAGGTIDAVVGNGADDNPNCDLIDTQVLITGGSCLSACGPQPAGGMACPSIPWSFSFSACGNGTITYQWRKDQQPITGATSPTYTIQHPTGADKGSYECIATNSCTSVPSTPAMLQVFVSDVNADGVVNTNDLALVLVKFGGAAALWGPGDLNGDGAVNTIDLAIVLGQFGKTCP